MKRFSIFYDDDLTELLKNGDLENIKIHHIVQRNGSLNTIYIKNNNDGKITSSLILSTYYGHSHIVKFLLEEESGTDVNYMDEYDDTALLISCNRSSYEIIKMLLENGADPNIYLGDGKNTVLRIACSRDDMDMMKLLLENGADPNIKNNNMMTPIAFCSTARALRYLIEYGADINTEMSDDGHTPLYFFTIKGIPEDIKFLLEIKGSVNLITKNKKGDTPLFSKGGNIECYKFLLENSLVEIDERNKNDDTALIWASARGEINSVKFFIENGANINAQNCIGNTPLMLASEYGNTEVVDFLCENGAFINIKNIYHSNSLFGACEYGFIEIVKILIKYGSNPNDISISQNTPLFTAILKNRYEIVKYLCENGADFNAKNINNDTPLLSSVLNGKNIDTIKLLLDKGADPNIMNRNFETSLFLAIKKKNLKIIKVLLEKGASLDIKNNKNETPFEMALKSGCPKIINYFEKIYKDV